MLPSDVEKFLKKIKNPKNSDRGDDIENIVGDSVTSAYEEGYYDGCAKGRYKLAQELIKMFFTV